MKKMLLMFILTALTVNVASCGETENNNSSDISTVSEADVSESDTDNNIKETFTTKVKDSGKAEETSAVEDEDSSKAEEITVTENEDSSEAEETTEKDTKDETSINIQAETEFEAEGNDFEVIDYELTTLFGGEDALAVKYLWTNNTNEGAMFSTEYDIAVFQNGIEVKDYDVSDRAEEEYSSNMPTSQGSTRTVKYYYELQDNSSVYLVVREFSWNGAGKLLLQKRIDIGGDEGYTIPDDTGETSIKFKDFSVIKNYDDQDCIILYFDLHNGEDYASMFNYSVDAYQGETELRYAYVNTDNLDGINNAVTRVLPGADATIYDCFGLADTSTDVRLEIYELDDAGYKTGDSFTETIKLN